MRYFKVVAKCGHVGRNNYILKTFYQKAFDGRDAANYVKQAPRVKHNHKDAIRDVVEITFEEYWQGKNEMSEDLYFQVHSKQEQVLLCPKIYEFILKEENEKHYHKKGVFRHVKHEILMKEKLQEMKGGYLYE